MWAYQTHFVQWLRVIKTFIMSTAYSVETGVCPVTYHRCPFHGRERLRKGQDNTTSGADTIITQVAKRSPINDFA